VAFDKNNLCILEVKFYEITNSQISIVNANCILLDLDSYHIRGIFLYLFLYKLSFSLNFYFNTLYAKNENVSSYRFQ